MVMVVSVTSEKDIEKLLEAGWVFCIVHADDDAYFNDVFFRYVPDEEKFRYGHGWFLKKSDLLFRRFVNVGMPKDSMAYDSCILMAMRKTNKNIAINLLSLKEGSSIEKIVKGILEDKERVG